MRRFQTPRQETDGILQQAPTLVNIFIQDLMNEIYIPFPRRLRGDPARHIDAILTLQGLAEAGAAPRSHTGETAAVGSESHPEEL